MIQTYLNENWIGKRIIIEMVDGVIYNGELTEITENTAVLENKPLHWKALINGNFVKAIKIEKVENI